MYKFVGGFVLEKYGRWEKYGRCEQCFLPLSPELDINGRPRRNKPCGCGHLTPIYESVMLSKAIRPIGMREAEVRAKDEIRKAIEFAWFWENMCRGPALEKASIEDIVGAITIDMQKITQESYVEKVGVEALKRMIKCIQRKMREQYEIELDTIQAAAVFANIYEPQAGSFGEIICQKGANSFYLGENIGIDPLAAAVKGSSSLEYIIQTGIESVRIVMGEAFTSLVPIGDSRYVMKVNNPKFPLVMARRPERKVRGKLFIFV